MNRFGLFEAMSAIEMMDPKMDAGMMCNQIRRKVLSLEQAVEVGTVTTTGTSHKWIYNENDSLLIPCQNRSQSSIFARDTQIGSGWLFMCSLQF